MGYSPWGRKESDMTVHSYLLQDPWRQSSGTYVWVVSRNLLLCPQLYSEKVPVDKVWPHSVLFSEKSLPGLLRKPHVEPSKPQFPKLVGA